jgi:hypothetical protein
MGMGKERWVWGRSDGYGEGATGYVKALSVAPSKE